MEFIVSAKKGATKKFLNYAERIDFSLPEPSTHSQSPGRSVLIEGPYGRIRPLRQFDSLVFIAGSTGATFTVPIMRDIVREWTLSGNGQSKKCSSLAWFSGHLSSAVSDVTELQDKGHNVALEISLYVTSDDVGTSDTSTSADSSPDAPREAGQIRFSYADERIGVPTTEVLELNSSSIDNSVSVCSHRCTRPITNEDTITTMHNDVSKEKGLLPLPASPPTIHTSASRKSTITRLSGRPIISAIVRDTAEAALGEIAVVVCGSSSLVQSARNEVVRVSDERAVHKGTGAQGIWMHAECFGYA